MIVLDCSAAIAILRDTEEGKALASLMLDGERVFAPTLFYSELGNTLWKYVRAGELRESQIDAALDFAIGLVDEFRLAADLILEATAEAIRCNHPVYDMLYCILARRQAATLFTLDGKLQKVCTRIGVSCVESSAW